MNKNKVKNTEFWEILALLHFYPHKYFPLKLIISLNTHICGPPNSKFLSNSCPARPTEARILLKETGGEMAGGKSPPTPLSPAARTWNSISAAPRGTIPRRRTWVGMSRRGRNSPGSCTLPCPQKAHRQNLWEEEDVKISGFYLKQ